MAKESQNILAEITTKVEELVDASQKALGWMEQAERLAQVEYEAKEKAIQQWRREKEAEARQQLDASLAQCEAEQAQLENGLGLAALPWEHPGWVGWEPTASNLAPPLIRAGTYQMKNAVDDSLWTPAALLPVFSDKPLIFTVRGAEKDAAADAIRSLMLRLLATIQPGTLRYTLIDPVGLGQNVAAFMPLADKDDQLVTSRAWTEPRHIEQRLSDLTEHMENVIQSYLRNEFPTIQAYNAKARVPEPYRLLVAFEFPTNFSEDAARRLVSIAQNGPRCGVYTIVLYDTDKPLPHGFSQDDLLRSANIIRSSKESGYFTWRGAEFEKFDILLDTLPNVHIEKPLANGQKTTDLANWIVDTVGTEAAEGNAIEVPFSEIAPAQEEWWNADTLDSIRVPLGPWGAKENQYLELGQGTAIHGLIAGRTGSGKSTLLHVLVTSAALRYSPDELHLYLIDFKKGVEFKRYADAALPHAKVIAIESEREFGLSVLEGLDAELKTRGDRFRNQGADGLKAYRNRTGETLPRILLLVDEFQEFFSEDDLVASQASQLLDRLVRQGRAFGIHVLLGSQTLSGAYSLARSTIEQMYVRIALQCSDADSRLILGEDNAAARSLTRPGEAIYNDANGLVEGNRRFQVAWFSEDDHREYLQRVSHLATARAGNGSSYPPPIVFEGNAPAHLEENRLLAALLADPSPATEQRRRLLWLGDPVAIKSPTAAVMRRQAGSNLLMVGQNPEAALGMTTSILLSIAAQYVPGTAQVHVFDFTPVDDPNADYLAQVIERLPAGFQYMQRRALPDALAALHEEYEERLAAEEVGIGDRPDIYLVLHGLQRARDLRPVADAGFGGFSSFDDEPQALRPDQIFPLLLREGPDLGIHTVTWCDSAGNLGRVLDWQSLREFETRVALQMGAEDSSRLIDSSAASKLGPYRAIYFSEEQGQVEKFRPYSLPTAEWLDSSIGQLDKRESQKGV
jgi:DNA segregation ATPase FtsK/SpoIIIE, S-DNA-T family